MNEKIMMYTVVYEDWEESRVNSVWFVSDSAQKRADELNANNFSMRFGWFVDEIELGDPNER